MLLHRAAILAGFLGFPVQDGRAQVESIFPSEKIPASLNAGEWLAKTHALEQAVQENAPEKLMRLVKQWPPTDFRGMEAWSQAVRHLEQRGHHAHAMALVSEWRTKCPDRVEPLHEAARLAQREAGDGSAATALWDEACRRFPLDPLSWRGLVFWQLSREDRTSAAGTVARALETPSSDFRFWREMAGLYQQVYPLGDGRSHRQRLTKVMELWEKATRLSGGEEAQVLAHVDFLREAAQWGEAIDLLQTLPRQEKAAVRERMIQLQLQIQDWEGARVSLEKWLEENPGDFHRRRQLAELLMGANEPAAAALQWELVLRDGPGDLIDFDALLRLQMALGATEAGLNTARRAIVAYPESPQIGFWLGLSLYYSGEYGEAAEAFDRTLALATRVNPEMLNADFHFYHGASLEQIKRFAEAEAAFRSSLELVTEEESVKKARSQNYLAYMWAERGENLEEAERLAREAISVAADEAAYWDTLGWVLFQRKMFVEARVAMRKAIDGYGEEPDAVVMDHLAQILAAQSEWKEAAEWAAKASALEPDDKAMADRANAYRDQAEKP
jgi:tetratricopeptide (TPR) repeat protein